MKLVLSASTENQRTHELTSDAHLTHSHAHTIAVDQGLSTMDHSLHLHTHTCPPHVAQICQHARSVLANLGARVAHLRVELELDTIVLPPLLYNADDVLHPASFTQRASHQAGRVHPETSPRPPM